MSHRFSPRFIFYNCSVQENLSIVYNEDGSIVSIEETRPDDRVEEVLLLPGFVNAHSHAFHRHLRGRSEIGGKSAETFWAWRDNMYALVDGVTEEKLYQVNSIRSQKPVQVLLFDVRRNAFGWNYNSRRIPLCPSWGGEVRLGQGRYQGSTRCGNKDRSDPGLCGTER